MDKRIDMKKWMWILLAFIILISIFYYVKPNQIGL